MAGIIKPIQVCTAGQGLYEVTHQVNEQLKFVEETQGLCSLFLQHTSCSLVIQENADGTARHDLQAWMNRLVPENDSLYTHIFEGKDDMPAHIKSMLTATQLSIPYTKGQLLLGTWQGIYLWEHRHAAHSRQIVIHLI